MIQPTFKSYFFSFFTLFVLNICFSQTTSSSPTTATEVFLGKDVNLDGDTDDTVILISSLSELLWITEKVRDEGERWSEGLIFLQTADIDASETQYWDDAGGYGNPDDATAAGNNEGWLPIGLGTTNNFQGFYNGDYHRILNLHIKREIKTDARNIGFISRINFPVSSAGLVR